MADKYQDLLEPPAQQQDKYADLLDAAPPPIQPVAEPVAAEPVSANAPPVPDRLPGPPPGSVEPAGSLSRTLGKVMDIGKEAFSDLLPPEIMTQIFGGTASGLRDEEKTGPLISPEASRDIIGALPASFGGGTELGRGLAAGTASALSEFSRPAAIAQLPAFAVPGVAETYALNVISELPEQYRGLRDIVKEHGINSPQTGEALAQYGLTDLMGALAGAHGVRKAGLSEALRPILEPGAARSEIPATPEFPVPTTETPPIPGTVERQIASSPVDTGNEKSAIGLSPAGPLTEPTTLLPEKTTPELVVTEGNMNELASSLGAVKAGKLPEVPLLTMAIEAPGTKAHGANFTVPIGATIKEAMALKQAKADLFNANNADELSLARDKESVLLKTVQERIATEGGSVESAPVEPTAPVEPITPVEPTKRTFKQRGPADSFGSSNTPVAAFLINDVGGVQSKSTGIKTGKYKTNPDLWDGAGGLSHPTHNKIYLETGETPDQAAQMLYDAGLIKEPTPDAMWDALRTESKSTRTQVAAERSAKLDAAEVTKQNKAFDKAAKDDSKPAVPVQDLQIGDAVTVAGEPFKVTEIDPDTFDVTLEDGKKFGVQTVKDGEIIYGEHEPVLPTTEASTSFTPFESGKPTEPSAVPTLRSGETQGDLLSKQQEDLTLIGEKGVDHGQVAADKAAAETTAEEARVKQEKEQTQLFPGEPEEVKGGVVSEDAAVAGTTDPVTARQISPQALGITHPLPGFLQDIVDYFVNNKPSQIWNSVKGSIGATLGKTFSRTTIADRLSGETGARWISARAAAPALADTFVANVLEGTGVDPVKFGAALTEDNLRSVRDEFQRRSDEAANRFDLMRDQANAIQQAKDNAAPKNEIKKLEREMKRLSKLTDEDMKTNQEQADAVTSIVGVKNSPFKTDAELTTFLKDPAAKSALDRHRALWEEVVDPMYRKAQLLDPDEILASRGQATAARINLYNDTAGTGKNVLTGARAGTLTATLRKKSPFAIQAKGTGQSYNVNYQDIMRNTFGRQLEIAAKNEFETQLVRSGHAVIGEPGLPPQLSDGETTVSFPLKRRSTVIDPETGQTVSQNQNIYVRNSLAGEYRRAADVDLLKIPAVVKAFNAGVNRAALAGLTDASVHLLNLSTALFTRPSVVGGVLTDSLLSATGTHAPVVLIKALVKSLQDNRAQFAQLAEIGATRAEYPTRNPLGKVIEWADKTTRLVLDDAYQSMVKEGWVTDTETNRREFVNQVGQYNKRAQGDLRRIARDSGLGPFATAGTTFNTLGLRTLTGSPGIPATSMMAAAALRANVMSKWVGGFVIAGALNYLLTKDKGGGVMGRPGVPVGKIDTGLDDENGRPLSLPLFDILGLGRALRVTGARGFIESQRKGLTLQNSFDAAATDAFNTNISPFTGPSVRFIGVASSGRAVPSINVPRTSKVVAPGESQAAENLKQAIVDANPIGKSIALAREPGQGAAAAIRQQIPRLALQPSQSADFMANYPQIVHRAQAREFLNDVIGRARKMNPSDQAKFVNEALDRLDPEDQKQARRTLKYSHIEY